MLEWLIKISLWYALIRFLYYWCIIGAPFKSIMSSINKEGIYFFKVKK